MYDALKARMSADPGTTTSGIYKKMPFSFRNPIVSFVIVPSIKKL
jgi:hypothetical protein